MLLALILDRAVVGALEEAKGNSGVRISNWNRLVSSYLTAYVCHHDSISRAVRRRNFSLVKGQLRKHYMQDKEVLAIIASWNNANLRCEVLYSPLVNESTE